MVKLTTGQADRPSRCCYAPQHIYLPDYLLRWAQEYSARGWAVEKRGPLPPSQHLSVLCICEIKLAEPQTLDARAVVAVAKRLCFSRAAVPGHSLSPIRVLLPNKPTTLTWTRPESSDNGPPTHLTAGGVSGSKNSNNGYRHGCFPPSTYRLLQRRCSNNKELHRGEPEVSSRSEMVPSMLLPGCRQARHIMATFLFITRISKLYQNISQYILL